MRITIVFVSLLMLGIGSIAISGNIVCGTHQGQIYMAAVHPTYIGFAGFYYSEDYGESIVLRDSAGDYIDYGPLFADAADSILYRGQGTLYIDPRFYITHDGGFTWDLIDTTVTGVMASGAITGELCRVVRRIWGRPSDRAYRSHAQYSPGFTAHSRVGLPGWHHAQSWNCGFIAGCCLAHGGSGAGDDGQSWVWRSNIYTGNSPENPGDPQKIGSSQSRGFDPGRWRYFAN